jgi:DNA-binding NtrC family response regulator
MDPPKTVITLGAELADILPDLSAALHARGFRIVSLLTPAALPPARDALEETVILVFNPRGQDLARRVLQAVRHRQVPVIVIADHPDVHEYYDLMAAGAFDYFELTAHIDWIGRAVEAAAAPVAVGG